ncbi:hypothetical protein MXM81_17800 [Serratia plymuthica]|uniref:hypothetical protein n=1 Tax=Enterobacterales TaxID=91347 RepID=UPI0015E4EF42|nr:MULTISPECIES: hypothetical protein [Enterobacterales]MDD9640744.1 hypothetical protein [Klebsiella michiganensis]MEB6540934.1 hypothetical protein [Serratia plymuthica]QLN51301.1 hypothetical protein HV046_29930 [Klebsiella grimontii]
MITYRPLEYFSSLARPVFEGENEPFDLLIAGDVGNILYDDYDHTRTGESDEARYPEIARGAAMNLTPSQRLGEIAYATFFDEF